MAQGKMIQIRLRFGVSFEFLKIDTSELWKAVYDEMVSKIEDYPHSYRAESLYDYQTLTALYGIRKAA